MPKFKIGDLVTVTQDILENDMDTTSPPLVKSGSKGKIVEDEYADDWYTIECQLANGIISWVTVMPYQIKPRE